MKLILRSAKFVPLWALLFLCEHAVAEQPAVRADIQRPNERKPAPAFRLSDASGKQNQLSKFRGRVILLNFWATECGGCKVEIPYFQEFDRAYRSKGFQAVGVSMEVLYQDLKGPEEGWARVNPFVQDHSIVYPILMADDTVSKAYGVDAMPATYLIDRKGRIAATYIGVVEKANVEANLKALLSER